MKGSCNKISCEQVSTYMPTCRYGGYPLKYVGRKVPGTVFINESGMGTIILSLN